jgi:hypothetical protein
VVRVVTGSAKGAGTDACVFVQLIGNAAKMDAPQELAASLTTRQPFERGQVRPLRLGAGLEVPTRIRFVLQTDDFQLRLPNLGRLEKLILSRNSRGVGDSWLLDEIAVVAPDGSETFFYCHSWVAANQPYAPEPHPVTHALAALHSAHLLHSFPSDRLPR